ncbi:MAG: type II toxin-antitoxin system RelE/ParE family toxin [Spirochaetaceae bacterium]|jgi:phage-related protein|nr:type II toxin-antitoxin system RelE/ParE family toxin [Spirochaetaceae bacterium]
MFEVVFYKNKNGNEPVFEYIKELLARKDKNSRINANKINDYIQILSEHGTRAGEPYVKHLDDDIWELRPLRNRILFAAHKGSVFVLLHYFMKQSAKTPKREIEKAKQNFADFIARSG